MPHPVLALSIYFVNVYHHSCVTDTACTGRSNRGTNPNRKVDSPPPPTPPKVFQDTVYCVTDSSTVYSANLCSFSLAMHHINLQHILTYLCQFLALQSTIMFCIALKKCLWVFSTLQTFSFFQSLFYSSIIYALILQHSKFVLFSHCL